MRDQGLTLVTGATDGIGKPTALELATRGLRVLVHGRSIEKASAACEAIRRAGGKDVKPVAADFSSLGEVRALGEQLRRDEPVLDVLVNNAGVLMKKRVLTADGHETTFQVNHLAPFLLTHLLLGPLRAAMHARVVNVSSMTHASGRIRFDDLELERGYDAYDAYSNSKLMNVLFTYELARRLGAMSTITVNALHPGVIGTKLLHAGFGGGGADVRTGARTSVKLATDPALANVTGKYFSNERETPSSPASHDSALMKRLYEVSCDLTGAPPLPS